VRGRLPIPLLAALVLVTGCGGGAKSTTSARSPTTASTPTTATAPSGGAAVPAYADVKKVALSDANLKAACSAPNDRAGGDTEAATDVLLYCGSRAAFEYTRFKSPSEAAHPSTQLVPTGASGDAPLFPLFRNGALIVFLTTDLPLSTQPLANWAKGFAAALERSCGCGEVVNGKL
jgi:hypothetical protein